MCALGALLTIGIGAAPAWALPPGAPDPPTVVGGNAQITVTFAAPADDGGSTILDYTATCTSSDGGALGATTGAGSPLTVSSLTNGNTYTCTVAARNADGTGPDSGASSTVIPSTVPDAPAAPAVTPGNAQIGVTFGAPAFNGGSPVTGYTATCTSSDGGALGAVSGAGSPLTVLSLTNGKTYTCTVHASNANGPGAESAASATAVPATVPAAPAAPTVVRGNAQIAVTFSAPANDGGSPITGYTATCTSSDGGALGAVTGAGSPLTVLSLTNGKTYTCTVHASNANGSGPESASSATAVPATVPAAPAAPTVAKGNGQLVVTIGAPVDNGSPVTAYSATCASSDGGVPGTVVGAASPITVTGLTNTKTYTCTALATNAIGPGPVSAPSAAIVVGLPDTLAQPTVVAGNNQAVVTFLPPVSNGGSPIISYSATCISSDGGTPGTIVGPVSPIAVTGLTNAKTYTCTVIATNAVGPSLPSPPSATVMPAAVPDAPAAPTVVAGAAKIVVTFTAPLANGSPITSYTASCTSSNGGVPGAHTRATGPITVTPLTNGKTYTCTVVARSIVGPSPPSPPSVNAVPATLPAPPTIRAAASGNGSLAVFFYPGADNGSAITSFTANCASSTGGVSGSIVGPSAPIVVTGLTNGQIYRCAVKATNGIGTSAASTLTKAVIVGQPGPPKITAIIPGPAVGPTGGFRLSFGPGPANGSAVTSYRATCKPVAGGATGFDVEVHSPAVVTGLNVARLYSCSAVATNAWGTSIESNAVRATVGTPAPPRVVQALPVASGLAFPFAIPANNGKAISNYRARCTSSDGGAPASPLSHVSPIVANLTPGKTYTCLVSAINVRGASPPTTVGPVVAGGGQITDLASCVGNNGGLHVTPGLLLAESRTHTLKLEATLGDCSGPFVHSAHLSVSFQSKGAYSCTSAIGVPNGGSGMLTWTAPVGLGTSGASIQFIVDSTVGHTTQAHFHGVVTSRANIFSDYHIDGSVTLDQGLAAVADGGDCSLGTRLQRFDVTAVSFTIS